MLEGTNGEPAVARRLSSSIDRVSPRLGRDSCLVARDVSQQVLPVNADRAAPLSQALMRQKARLA